MSDMNKILIMGGTMLLCIIILFFLIIFTNNYERYSWNGEFREDQVCVYYYQSCSCYGILEIMESFPEQFRCNGIEICRDISKATCE